MHIGLINYFSQVKTSTIIEWSNFSSGEKIYSEVLIKYLLPSVARQHTILDVCVSRPSLLRGTMWSRNLDLCLSVEMS